MHFVFPKNYNFKPKFLGILSYSTAIFNACWALFLYLVLNSLFSNINIKIFTFISLFFPIFLISIIGLNRESFCTVLRYFIKFVFSQKVYLYKK